MVIGVAERFSKCNFFLGRNLNPRTCRDCIKTSPYFLNRSRHWSYITGDNRRFSVFGDKFDHFVRSYSSEAFQVKKVSVKRKDCYSHGCSRVDSDNCKFTSGVFRFNGNVSDFIAFNTSYTYLSIIACHWMYWYLSAFCIHSEFRPDIATETFYIYGFESDAFLPRKIFEGILNLPAPLKHSSVYLPAVSVLAPSSPS